MSEAMESRGESKVYFNDAVLQWWSYLQEHKGARASLRHCHSPAEIALTEAFYLLHRRLVSEDPIYIERLATLAGVLAHVDENEPSATFASQLGQGDDKARVSGLRFRRLLSEDEPEAQMLGLIRAVRLLGRRANIIDLARSIRFWGARTKQRWAVDYYSVASHQD